MVKPRIHGLHEPPQQTADTAATSELLEDHSHFTSVKARRKMPDQER